MQSVSRPDAVEPVAVPRCRRFRHALAGLALALAGTAPAFAGHPGQAQLVAEVAQATGQDPAELNAMLDGAQFKQGIIDAISRPAEAKPWKDYRPIFLTSERIDQGVAFYVRHRPFLAPI